ncbi:hypothetical protein FA95DRAFT_1607617 [Auriscalpium vulgare]|uniref:Uncharacterized protein n=1 Tax=Auriscalpium vulgare TaxID=40419 RepID=A0ACB8RMV7_9AGAM|nr:hypothetical protein FA95DRAFT_1607617 [Auriscalpium vulgare]
MARFVRTLRTAPHLAGHVRSFYCELGSFKHKPIYSDDAMEALSLCRNVDGITISLFGATAALLAHLDTLPVRPSFLSIAGLASTVDHVIQLWPSIRVLEMGTVLNSSDTHVRMSRELQALSAGTRDLRIYCCAPTTVIPAGLQDLELICHEKLFRPTLAALVSAGMAAQLRSLYLFGYWARVPPPAVLEKLAALESFVLDSLPTEASGLPQNLCHLGYHFHGIGDEPSEKLQILLEAARTLPKLNLITATRQSSPEVLEDLESR